jgi:hypothetical protein
MRPVVSLSGTTGKDAVAWNIGNEDAKGFIWSFLDAKGSKLGTANIPVLKPDQKHVVPLPVGASSILLTNPAGAVNLYTNRTDLAVGNGKYPIQPGKP